MSLIKRKAFIVTTLAVVAVGSWFFLGGAKKPFSKDIRLVLLLVADQFPAEYLDRFDHLLTGGLRFLKDKGISFTETHFNHAATATCPGHASLISGTHPAKSGIINNVWFDRAKGKQVYCVEDWWYGRSPRKLLSSSFGDWLKNHNRGVRVFSASAKDRAAIMMGGHRADAAFWYNRKNGKFVSSNYYMYRDPKWLKEFNGKKLANRHFGQKWEPIEVDANALKRAQIVDLDEGVFPKKFPHALGKSTSKPNSSFYSDIYASPFADQYLTDFATALIENESIGAGDSLDFLALSFSALDTVGHGYGPHSREILDTLLRLDKNLDVLLELLDQSVGLENILIAFSSDHGVQRLPEVKRADGKFGHRQTAHDVACYQQVAVKAKERFEVDDLFQANLYLNEKAIRNSEIKRLELDKLVLQELSQCKMIDRVWPSSSLFSEENDDIPLVEKHRNGYYPKRSADFIVQLEHSHLSTLHRGTGHGSPHDYDTHVPFIIYHHSLNPSQIDQSVFPVDLAPTLADLIGIESPENLDGVSRVDLLKTK